MERVLGIGGVFFRAKDPEMLGAWYEKCLGVDPIPKNYDQPPWNQQSGPTVFAPFENETDYFGNPERQWMVNFRVSDLDAIVAQLRSFNVEVKVDPEAYPNGRFARLSDPEGNPVELWEPL